MGWLAPIWKPQTGCANSRTTSSNPETHPYMYMTPSCTQPPSLLAGFSQPARSGGAWRDELHVPPARGVSPTATTTSAQRHVRGASTASSTVHTCCSMPEKRTTVAAAGLSVLGGGSTSSRAVSGRPRARTTGQRPQGSMRRILPTVPYLPMQGDASVPRPRVPNSSEATFTMELLQQALKTPGSPEGHALSRSTDEGSQGHSAAASCGQPSGASQRGHRGAVAPLHLGMLRSRASSVSSRELGGGTRNKMTIMAPFGSSRSSRNLLHRGSTPKWGSARGRGAEPTSSAGLHGTESSGTLQLAAWGEGSTAPRPRSNASSTEAGQRPLSELSMVPPWVAAAAPSPALPTWAEAVEEDTVPEHHSAGRGSAGGASGQSLDLHGSTSMLEESGGEGHVSPDTVRAAPRPDEAEAAEDVEPSLDALLAEVMEGTGS